MFIYIIAIKQESEHILQLISCVITNFGNYLEPNCNDEKMILLLMEYDKFVICSTKFINKLIKIK